MPTIGSNYSEFDASKSPRRNVIINGNFDIWQRGVTLNQTGGVEYLCDRWGNGAPGGSTITTTQVAFTTGQSDVPNEPVFYINQDRTVTGAQDSYIQQLVEDVRTLAGKTVTLSFWARSADSIAFQVTVTQTFDGGSANVTALNEAVTLTTGWVQYTFTFDVPDLSGQTIGGNNSSIRIRFENDTANGNSEFDLAQVQLEEGPVATDFESQSQDELISDCQRYFEKSYNLGDDPGDVTNNGRYGSNSTGTGGGGFIETLVFKTAKRTSSSTVTIYNTATGTAGEIRDGGGNDLAATALNVGRGSVRITCSPVTDNEIHNYHWTADAEL